MNAMARTREDFGKICVAQRDNALSIPHALMKKTLTLDEYMAARPISDPIHLFDCVMPCAGAEAFLVCREDTAKSLGLPCVRMLVHHRAAQRLPRRSDPDARRLGDRRRRTLGDGGRDARRRRLRRDLRRLPGDLHDAVRGPRLLQEGRGARLRPLAHASPTTARSRTTPRAASFRSGRPARPAAFSAWSRRCASSPGSRSAPRCPMPRSAWSPASA